MVHRTTTLLIVTSCLLGMAVAELMIRLVAPQPLGVAVPMYEPDDTLSHRLRPSFRGTIRSGEFSTSVRINAQGFRGRAWSADAAPRVLVLGDSFTFGWGVEEECAFPSILEDSLAKTWPGVRVYNAGVPGYGTLQERALADRLVPAWRPQVVVLAFTVGSDLQDNLIRGLHPEAGFEVRDGFLVERGTPRGAPLPFKAWLQEHSHLYVLVQRARVRAALGFAPARREACAHFLAHDPCGDTACAWDLTLEAVRELASTCRAARAHVVVLAIPHPVQVDERLWHRELARVGGSGLSRWEAQRRLEAECRRAGLTFVDPGPVFSHAGSSRLYYRIDRHLTPRGHLLLAEAVLPALEAVCGASIDNP